MELPGSVQADVTGMQIFMKDVLDMLQIFMKDVLDMLHIFMKDVLDMHIFISVYILLMCILHFYVPPPL